MRHEPIECGALAGLLTGRLQAFLAQTNNKEPVVIGAHLDLAKQALVLLADPEKCRGRYF